MQRFFRQRYKQRLKGACYINVIDNNTRHCCIKQEQTIVNGYGTKKISESSRTKNWSLSSLKTLLSANQYRELQTRCGKSVWLK